MRKTGFIAVLLLFCNISSLYAQYEKTFMLGFKAGAAYSGISNIAEMLYPEDYFDPATFHVETKRKFGFVGGVFLHFDIPKTYCSVQPEMMYSMQGAELSYSDINNFRYTATFNYNYISVGLLFKTNVVAGLNLRAGPRLGFVLNPEAIEYSSNTRSFTGGAYGEDIDIRQGMRNVLKGGTDFTIGAGIGYEFAFGFGIDAMYYWGLSDVIITYPNSYGFIENTNYSNSIQLTITYSLPLNTTDRDTERSIFHRSW